MESNWCWNAVKYGLVNYYAYQAYAFGVRPVLYARILGSDYLATNHPLNTSGGTKPLLLITGDGRVDYAYTEAVPPDIDAPFPYGWAVEPDQGP